MIEKPKKERRFLKILGKVGEILVQELLIKVGKSLVQKIGGKKTLPSIIFLSLFYNVAYASIDSIPYPITGNKQRLGWQTSGNGLVWRGRSQDTITKPSNYANKDIKAYLLLDTVNNVLYNYIASKGGWQFSNTDSIIINNNFTQPVDSLFFKTGVPTNNVDTAKMRWDSDLGTVVLGMYDKVPNELGFKSFWLVKNQTGSTITKGSIVYANGTVGASGRITVAKFIANGTIEAKYLLGVTAHDLTDGEDGYVISFGKIRQVNTDTFAAGAILYPSPTTAGVWTDVEPIAPNIDMPIGFCINSSSNNGTIAIRVASGYKLSELHDVAISSPVDKASLYYSGGLWMDTTAALLVSDTASMLLPYLRKLDTITLSNRINNKLNISDTASMLTPYFRDADTTLLDLTSRFASKLNLSDTASMLTNYLRTGVAASTYLTQSNASSTYLPLTGGTLTGLLKNTSQRITGNITISDFDANYSSVQIAPSSSATVNLAIQQNITGAANISMGGNQGGGGEPFNPNIYFTDNRKAYASIGGIHTSSGTNNQSGHIVFNTTPSLNSIALTERMRIAQDGAITMGGTLGVTGATTLSAPLTVNSSAVFNEGSADADFRVESDGNANMVFVDASTDRVGIGTNTPTKTLDVNGEVKIATTTATPTSLLGKDGSNVVGNVRVITPLALAGDSINLNTIPISKGGTGSTSESGARSNLGVGYVFYASTAGDAVQLSSNKVFIVNSGGASTTTITLGTATAGRLYMIKNLATGTVVSNSSNVIPLNGGSAGTAILSAGNTTTQWCTLVCDGTNWHIMQSN